jgi:hypothetical protein
MPVLREEAHHPTTWLVPRAPSGNRIAGVRCCPGAGSTSLQPCCTWLSSDCITTASVHRGLSRTETSCWFRPC